jgi:hypothetical protein
VTERGPLGARLVTSFRVFLNHFGGDGLNQSTLRMQAEIHNI